MNHCWQSRLTLLGAAGQKPSAPLPGLLQSWPGLGGSRCTAGPRSGPGLTAEKQAWIRALSNAVLSALAFTITSHTLMATNVQSQTASLLRRIKTNRMLNVAVS